MVIFPKLVGKMMGVSCVLLAAVVLNVNTRVIDNKANLQPANNYDYGEQGDYSEESRQGLTGAEGNNEIINYEKEKMRDPRESDALDIINTAANVAEDTCHSRMNARAEATQRDQNNEEMKDRADEPGTAKLEGSNVNLGDQQNVEQPSLKAQSGNSDFNKQGETDSYRQLRENSIGNLGDLENVNMQIKRPEESYEADNDVRGPQIQEYSKADRSYSNAQNENYVQEQEGGVGFDVQQNAQVGNEEVALPAQYEQIAI